jgi:hypothetical protein
MLRILLPATNLELNLPTHRLIFDINRLIITREKIDAIAGGIGSVQRIPWCAPSTQWRRTQLTGSAL